MKNSTLFSIVIPLMALSSCGTGSTAVIWNKYPDFLSWKNATNQSSGHNLELLFDTKECITLQDFEVSYYINGVCSHGSKHHEFDSVCPNISPFTAWAFLTNGDLKIAIGYDLINHSTPYHSKGIALQNIQEEDLKGKSSIVLEAHTFLTQEIDYVPSESKLFGFRKETGGNQGAFLSHSKVLSNQDGNFLASITYGSLVEEAEQSRYSDAILAQWESVA